MKRKFLPLNFTEDEGLFYVSSGAPVWPVRNLKERQALEQIVGLFAANLKTVRARKGTLPNRGRETVIAIGHELRSHARLYGHLTRRKWTSVTDGEDLIRRGCRPHVVITRPEQLNDTLLEYLTAPKRSIPGIICGNSESDLHMQVLIRSAAAHVCGPVKIPRVEFFPLREERTKTSPDNILINNSTQRDVVRRTLAGEAGVLTIHTHSDGIDAHFGTDLVMCAIESNLTRRFKKSAPQCLHTGICYRRKMPIDEVRKRGNFFSPTEFAARVLILNTCHGFRLNGGAVEPEWGYASYLFNNPRLGAIVLSWEIIVIEADSENTIAERLVNGSSIGQAMASLMNSPSAKQKGVRFCLFGDPRVRITYQKSKPRIQGTRHSIAATRSADMSQRSEFEVGFLHACLEIGIRHEAKNRSKYAERALRRVKEYEFALAMGKPLEGSNSSPGARMRKACLNYFFNRGELYEDWHNLAEYQRVIRQSHKCPQCGSLVKSCVASMRRVGAGSRRLVACPHCDIIEDAPLGTNIKMSVKDRNVVHLAGELPSKNWIAGLMTGSWQQDKLWEWPADSDGGPAKYFEPPSGLPNRHVFVVVFILWEDFVASYRLRTNGRGSTEKYLNTPSPLLRKLRGLE